MATVDYPHISIDSKSVPYISGTRTKVRSIVMDHIGHGWDAQEIYRQHPHLTLGQIHSALAYYYDHQSELDAEIAHDAKETDRIFAEIDQLQVDTPLAAKLKAAELTDGG